MCILNFPRLGKNRASPPAIELRTLPSISKPHPPTRHENTSPIVVEESKGLKTNTIVSIEDAEVLDPNRLPSPTPEEEAFLARNGIFDWERMKDWRFWARRGWIGARFLEFLLINLTQMPCCSDSSIYRHWHTTSLRFSARH